MVFLQQEGGCGPHGYTGRRLSFFSRKVAVVLMDTQVEGCCGPRGYTGRRWSSFSRKVVVVLMDTQVEGGLPSAGRLLWSSWIHG